MKSIICSVFAFLSLVLSFPVSAFCVYNDSSISIYGVDDNRNIFNARWKDTDLMPNDYTCCSSSKKSCDHATLDLSRSFRDNEYGFISTNPYCPKITLKHDSDWIKITGDTNSIQCELHSA